MFNPRLENLREKTAFFVFLGKLRKSAFIRKESARDSLIVLNIHPLQATNYIPNDKTSPSGREQNENRGGVYGAKGDI